MEVHTAAISAPTSEPPSPSSLHSSRSAPKSPLVSMAISPENEPHPSWTFFPPSATYIPHAPTSPTSSPPLAPRRTSPQPAPSTTALNTNLNKANHLGFSNSKNVFFSTTPSTHHRILDHCFHLSIETRLKQAEAQYLASTQEQAAEHQIKEHGGESRQTSVSTIWQDDWRRRQRSLVDEAAVLGRKGSNVEAIVDGILKSHRSSGPLQSLPRHLKHRLHLCQLTSMVFGRFDTASSTNNPAGLNIYSSFHLKRHRASQAAIQRHLTNNPQGQKTRAFFANPIQSSSFCRRHHRRDCQRTCCTLAKLQQQQQLALEQKKKLSGHHQHQHVNTAGGNARTQSGHQRVAGLVDAIPAFLKCSAMSYSDIGHSMVDKGEIKDMSESGVLEGWYRLLLEMMTQTIIESYLCDGASGVETILDVFSYGDDSDSFDQENQEDVVMEDVPQNGSSSNDSQEDDEILFFKSAEYDAFKKAKDERLKEFLSLNGSSMENHFVQLAVKYPLIVFERQMTHYIIRSQKLLVDPKLSRSAEEIGFLIPPATSAYPDGSLSMPVSDDEDDEETLGGFARLEAIKEEEHDGPAAVRVHYDDSKIKKEIVEGRRSLQPVQQRHEKMRLATITTSMEDDEEEKKTAVVASTQKKNSSIDTKGKIGGGGTRVKTEINHRKESVAQLPPSPPPSAVGSRSSTVSPSTSTAPYSEEEEESIAEAARILTASSSSKKHSFASVMVDDDEAKDLVAAKRIKTLKI